MPAGSFNIVTGDRDDLGETLALHDDVDAVWYFGPKTGRGRIETASAGNLKRVWTGPVQPADWSAEIRSGEFLRQAVKVKNIWIPHGD